jgi:outer membrane lipoprotein SlyB
MGGIQRATNMRQQPDTGKVWSSLGGAVLGGLLGGLTGNPVSLVQGVIGGGMKGAEIYDTFAPQKQVDPTAGLGATAIARMQNQSRFMPRH